MTDKELRKLNRAELLEILVQQSKEIDELRVKLKSAEEKLEKRELVFEKAGSIAEAALELNDVFSVAQKAADEYLGSVKALSERYEKLLEENYRRRAERQEREFQRIRIERESDVPPPKAEEDTEFRSVDSQILAHRGFGKNNTSE